MSGLWQDVKFGIRVLVRNPGFTLAAVISLALGFGANTAIFSVANGLLLRRLPVSEPDRLVTADAALTREIQDILLARGFYEGATDGIFGDVTRAAFRDFMGWENYDERIREDDRVDLDVMEDIRRKHAAWVAERAAAPC